MSDREEFARRLRGLRKRAGMTQDGLSEQINVSIKTVQRWEFGERSPRAEDITKLASALHVTEAELLNGPEVERVSLTLTWDMEDVEGEIDMSNGNGFNLVLGDDGRVGVKGVAKFASLSELKEFAANFAKELEDGYKFQVERGRIPAMA